MEFENKDTNAQQEQQKDGFQNEQREIRPGRSPRPRIHNNTRPTYQKREEESFRPEGFGAGLTSSAPQRPSYRPRPNYGGGYNPNRQQGGGYQQREGGYQKPYKPYKPYGAEGAEGGYQPRQHGGYQPRQGQGEYGQQRGGYQPRQQGGYQPRQGQGEYGQQRGGYQPRQQGGYQSRPQQGGYGKPYNKQGGYGKPYNKQGGFRQRTADYDPNAKYSLKKRIEYKEQNYDPNEPIRLNKFLANAGVCSRREADEFIQAGVVSVNGEVITELGAKVLRTDEVRFHDQPVTIEKKVYVLLNKPKDYVTTSDDPQQRKTVMDLVKGACPERIYPVGRLDRNTTGVLLLTNDGDMASKLTHPKYLKKKIYHVFLDKACAAHDLRQIAEGIQLDDGEIKADDVQYAHPTDRKQVGIEIHSGKNRIVRRIFESLGYRVTKLDRVQFAGLTKKNLRRGDWRYLTEEEVDRLRMGAYE